MLCLCERVPRGKERGGIRIWECRGLDGLAALPTYVEGLPVTELAPYAFSVHGRREDRPAEGLFWWEDAGQTAGTMPEDLKEGDQAVGNVPGEPKEAGQTGGAAAGLPALRGDRLTELRLPPFLEKVGAYALYNCEKLRRIEVSSRTLDWGAGVFTGCYGVTELLVHVDENSKSCLREILAELRQTLELTYLPETAEAARPGIPGRALSETAEPARPEIGSKDRMSLPSGDPPQARLIFPEYFEEAVENTPARILVTETHGCGHKYRNAFVRTQFQFREYDSLFPHVQVQEPEGLVARLALNRLMYPYQLEEPYRKRYLEYLSDHACSAAAQAISGEEMEQLRWLFGNLTYDSGQISLLLEQAGKEKKSAVVSYLMEQKRRTGAVGRRRFSL